jgi:Thyroglobulin type-1 repeat.
MLRGVPTPMPGFFVPRCDDDGFFMPQQCNPRKECWCVDRNGGEYSGSRVSKKSAVCACKYSFIFVMVFITLIMRRNFHVRILPYRRN